MDVVLPGAGSLEDYWHNLVNGVDAITEAPPHRVEPEFYDPEQGDRPNRLYCRRGGFVDEFAYFEPVTYGVMPASVHETEPEQLIALRVAAAAIEDAGGADRLPDRDRIGVILGRLGQSSMAHMRFYSRVRLADQMCNFLRELIPAVTEDQLDRVHEKINKNLGPHHPESVIGLMPNLTASRIANRLNLRGPAYTIDAACASSLIAVDHGIAELASGRLDAVLVGGVHHNHDGAFWSVFNQLRALSRRQEIRPFDALADGLLIGEGTGVVMLKRLPDAVRDGDRIHAVIRGTGTSSDGRSASLVNPETSGQVVAVRRAWAAAGLDPAAPDSLGLLEAHGTATPVGDAAELATMAEVFGPRRGDSPPVIGSVKSMIGHSMPAAGVAGLVKAVLAVSRKMLLPTLHCDNPRPELAGTRFMPIAVARPWNGSGPRRAAVNAFGFGGINAHVIVEEAPDAPRSRRRTQEPAVPAASAQVEEPEQIVLLTAPDQAAVARLLDADDREVRAYGTAHGLNGAGSAAVDRAAAGGCRLGIVGPTAERLAAARKVVAAGAAWRGGRDIWFSPRPMLADGEGKIAFLFPGLEAELSHSVDDVVAHFGLAAAGATGGEEDFSGRFIEVMRLGWLLHDALGRIGVTPDAVAGHSLGEWTAGLVAGLVDESKLGDYAAVLFNPVIERQDLLHAVIGASAESVAARLPEYPGVSLSHDNAPAQSVVCGPVEQVTRLIEELGRQNTLCRPLPFATGIHTPYVAQYLEPLRSLVEQQETRSSRIQVWSATLAAPLPADPPERRELFVRQLVEPVRFRSTVAAMHDAGIRAFLQVGPGQLASLIHDNLRGRDHLAIPVNVAFRSGLAQLRRVATALWVEGYAPDLSALDPAARPKSAQPPAARPAAAGRGLTMRLNLGSDRITLGEGAGDLLGAGAVAATPRAGASSAAAAGTTALARLNLFAGRSAASAELAALLEDTADAAVVVLTAAGQRTGKGGYARQPEAPASRPAVGGWHDHKSVLRISLDAMPYLTDHCFFPQPDDWPHMADRMPVVPATTIIQHMIDTVAAMAPGMRVVRVSDARFRNWTVAEPAQDVEIVVTRGTPGEFTVAFGPYARATIHTAVAYPADPPPEWRHDPATEWPTPLSVERMYATRIMFHGPRYRGVIAVRAVGERHIRGLLRMPMPPGAGLDSGLQLLGNWLNVTQRDRKVIFPTGFRSIRFYGPEPAAGEMIECVARFPSVSDREITADIQYFSGGRLWALAEGSVHRRFDSHPQSRAAELAPGRHAVALRQPEGWVVTFDYWPDPATQNSIAALTMGAGGYLEYDKQPVARRKRWLLGRLAVKDAVRFLMWDDDGAAEIFPIEIRVSADSGGRARTDGWPGRGIPSFEASLAHAGEAGVAIARPAVPAAVPGAPGMGIGIAEIADAAEPAPPAALSDQELATLEAASAAEPGSGRALWLTRFLAAREAAAQAEGTGPGGAPHLVTVTGATPAVITVAASGRTYRVSHREIRNPDELPARRYAVAWTRGPERGAPR